MELLSIHGALVYVYIFVALVGKQVHFQTEKKWQKENEKLPIFCRMQSYFPPSFCIVAVCVAVLHLIAVAHNYSFPLEKHFFAEKKLV